MTSAIMVSSTRPNIRDLTDFLGRSDPHSGEVEIRISVEGVHPPVGSVTWSEDEQATPFSGWLGLLAVLSNIFDRGPAAASDAPASAHGTTIGGIYSRRSSQQ
jgi:hypothetical protein